VTISLDTSALEGSEPAGLKSTQELEDGSCGDPMDWLRSIGALPPVEAQENLSGGVLAKVIEREIIPRLFLAHLGPANGRKTMEATEVIATADSDAFAEIILTQGFPDIMDRVQSLIDRGVSLQRIYLDLLAPMARRLGELWQQDRCTFTDVTLGLARLQQVLREVGRRSGESIKRATPKARVYLAPAPGEQHTFGLSMVEEYFLHAGWETAIEHVHATQTILQTVAKQRLDVIGFSVGCEEFFNPLMDLAQRVRKSSLNREAIIMVGGKFIIDHPEIASQIKDITFVSDGATAVESAETLIRLSAGPYPASSLT
jgi:MerR family transcriptional regulator, light-induced transcriptional regulator